MTWTKKHYFKFNYVLTGPKSVALNYFPSGPKSHLLFNYISTDTKYYFKFYYILTGVKNKQHFESNHEVFICTYFNLRIKRILSIFKLIEVTWKTLSFSVSAATYSTTHGSMGQGIQLLACYSVPLPLTLLQSIPELVKGLESTLAEATQHVTEILPLVWRCFLQKLLSLLLTEGIIVFTTAYPSYWATFIKTRSLLVFYALAWMLPPEVGSTAQ